MLVGTITGIRAEAKDGVLCWAQNKTQGPCSLRQYRDWMRDMRSNPNLQEEYKQFCEVSAWQVCIIPYTLPLLIVVCALERQENKAEHFLEGAGQ